MYDLHLFGLEHEKVILLFEGNVAGLSEIQLNASRLNQSAEAKIGTLNMNTHEERGSAEIDRRIEEKVSEVSGLTPDALAIVGSNLDEMEPEDAANWIVGIVTRHLMSLDHVLRESQVVIDATAGKVIDLLNADGAVESMVHKKLAREF